MDIIVCKFGGSSLSSAERFMQVAAICAADERRRYVVLSAPGAQGGEGKVTDLLEAAWRGKRDAVERVVRRYHDIAAGLGLAPQDAMVRAAVKSALRVSHAATLSRGEYLCAQLYARFAGLPFMDAAALLCFDADGALSVSRTLKAVRRAAADHPRLVIPGFYGADPSGRIVTLPRNGSDITGALVAAGCGAALYENWTDVPGLMSDDPAVNPDAQLIPEIRYADVRRMAEGGARVLHPDCLTPLEAAGIPTRVRCTMDPDGAGTVIR